MAAIVAGAVSYIARLFDTPYDPVRVDMPMDPEEPCYSLSFSKDQVTEYKEVGCVTKVTVLTIAVGEVWVTCPPQGVKLKREWYDLEDY